MTQRSLTVVLTGALLAACSKPNPLFLDPFGGATDGSGEASATLTEPSPPTTTTTTTTPTPTTTTPMPVTSTTTGDPSTTGPSTTGTSAVDPTVMTSGSSGTTGEPFFCELAPQEHCCGLELEVVADNFFTDAYSGLGPGCPLVDDPPVDFTTPTCKAWSFGKTSSLRIFHDPAGGMQVIKGASAMALRFPMENGELVHDGQPIPWAAVASMTLEIHVDIDWMAVSELYLKVSGLPADQEWSEGEGQGPVPCKNGNSSHDCRVCGPIANEQCQTSWGAPYPLNGEDLTLEGVEGTAPDTLAIDIPVENTNLLMNHPNGLVVLPQTVKLNGMPLDHVPTGAITAFSREADKPAPRLRLLVCDMP